MLLHPAPEEGGELVGRASSHRCLRGWPEQRHPVRPAEGVRDREPRPHEQLAGKLGVQVGVMPDGAREIPAVGELLGGGQTEQRGFTM
jgi:hypothetical protein